MLEGWRSMPFAWYEGMKLVQLFKIYWPDNGGGIAAVMDMVSDAADCMGKALNRTECRQEMVVCRPRPGMPSKQDCYKGKNVYRCRSFAEIASTPVSIEFLVKARKAAKDADIVIYHFPYPMADIGILFRLYRGKLIVWWHCDFDTQKGKILTRLYRPIVKHTLKKADIIIVSAKGNINGSQILRKYKDKCRVIPFAVPDDLAQKGRTYYESRNSGTRRKVHVLFIGRFVWYKGLDVLLKAFAKLDHKKYELLLVGDGPLLSDMQSLAKHLNLNNVAFAGSVSQDEKIKKIQWSDFLVLPSVSKAEAFGIVQIEAMAFGKPVINTSIPGGVPEICPNGVCGITVRPHNKKELARAIKRLGEDTSLRETYGKRAIELVKEKYNTSRMVRQYINVFQNIMETSGS